MHDSAWTHAVYILSGSTAMAFIGHMVNTFPTPTNIYGQWFLGCLKFLVGQRISAMNAFRGNDTMVVSVPQGTGTGSGATTEVKKSTVEVTPETITVTDLKQSKTTVPNPSAPPNPADSTQSKEKP